MRFGLLWWILFLTLLPSVASSARRKVKCSGLMEAVLEWTQPRRKEFSRMRQEVEKHLFLEDPTFVANAALNMDQDLMISFDYGILGQSEKHPPVLNELISDLKREGGRVSVFMGAAAGKFMDVPKRAGTFGLDEEGKPFIVIAPPPLGSRDKSFREIVAHEGAHFRRWLKKRNELMAAGSSETEAANAAAEHLKKNLYPEERAAVAAQVNEIRTEGASLADPQLIKTLNYPDGLMVHHLLKDNQTEAAKRHMANIIRRGLRCLKVSVDNGSTDPLIKRVIGDAQSQNWQPFWDLVKPPMPHSNSWNKESRETEEQVRALFSQVLYPEITRFEATAKRSNKQDILPTLQAWKKKLEAN